jgi:hypothetical protein
MEQHDVYFETESSDDIVHQEPFVSWLIKDAQRMSYQRIKGTAPNKGQRKLLLAKLLFLLDVRKRLIPGQKIHIVYVGAAPGCSIHILDELLNGPSWITRWELYDMIPMDSRLRETPRFGCHQQYFTDDDAASYRDWNQTDYSPKLIFLTDIRLSPDMPRNSPNFAKAADLLIWKDVHLDHNWILIMRPWMWWRKFRMPYAPVDVEESEKDGSMSIVQYDSMQCIPSETIYYQAWVGAGSTETRSTGTLENIEDFVRDPEDPAHAVNFKTYEEQLQYYNAKQRPISHSHNVRYKGLCYCTDCNIEIFTICRFLTEFKGVQPTTRLVVEFITFLDSQMPDDSQILDTKTPHGKYPLLSDTERAKLLKSELKTYQKTKNRKNHQRMGGTSEKKKCPKCGTSYKITKTHQC